MQRGPETPKVSTGPETKSEARDSVRALRESVHAAWAGAHLAELQAGWLQLQRQARERPLMRALKCDHASVAALRKKCWELKQKHVALEEDLLDRNSKFTMVAHELNGCAQRLRGDLQEVTLNGAHAREACRKLQRDLEVLRSTERSLRKEVQALAGELQPAPGGDGLAPGEDEENLPPCVNGSAVAELGSSYHLSLLDKLREAQQDEHDAEEALAQELRVSTHQDLESDTQLEELERTTKAAVEQHVCTIQQLERQLARATSSRKELLRGVELWRFLHDQYEARAETCEEAAAALEQSNEAARLAAAAKQQHAEAVTKQIAAAEAAVAQARKKLQADTRRRWLAHASPIIASVAASIYWLAF